MIPAETSTKQLLDGNLFPTSWGVLHSDVLMHPVDVSNWPVKLTSHRQLFLDDYLIAETHSLTRTLHQPTTHPANPLMTGQTDLEGGPRWGPVLAYVLQDPATKR